LDAFLKNAFPKIKVEDFSSEEFSFLNYLHSENLLPYENKNILDQLLSEVKDLDSKTPGERYVLAMAEGSQFPGNVYVRGSPHNLGDPVHGRNLTALGGQSGSRLDLAQQLTSSDNPLVARVMANRIWLQFFWAGNCSHP